MTNFADQKTSPFPLYALPLALGASTLGVVPVLSTAQERAGSDADSDALEEVVVTALKRDQTLYEAPVSITVLSQEDLQILGTQELEDVARFTPNLNASSRGGRRRYDISIRGVRAQAGVSTTFGIYLDEFNISPTSISSFNNPSLQDAAQVEVLRGPQGVYFGRSIMAGSINITTNKPTDEFEGDVSARIGSNERYQVRGAIGGPITDDLGFRLVAYREEFGGFMENLGPINVSNDFEEQGFRLALRWTPTDRTTLDFAAARVDAEDGARNTLPINLDIPQVQSFLALTSLGVFPDAASLNAAQGTPLFGETDNQINVDEIETTDNNAQYFTFRGEHEFDGFSLIGVAGYLDGEESRNAQERDWLLTNTSIDTPLGFPGTFVADYDLQQDITVESYSFELRLQSNDSGPLQWVIGAFYAEDEEFSGGRDSVTLATFADGAPLSPFFPIDVPFATVDDLDVIESRAIFGDISYDFLDGRLTLSAGARYSDDNFSSEGRTALPLTPGPVFVDDEFRSTSFNHFAPTLTASFALSDNANIYAKAANAYRPGGFNNGVLVPPTYDPEEIWNYELGLKGVFLDGMLDLRAAVFSMSWEDMQVPVFDVETGNFTDNAAEASIDGAELETIVTFTENLRAMIGIGYTDARFDSFPNAGIQGSGQTFDLSGTHIAYAPEWNVNATLEYVKPLANGAQLLARGEYQYTDDQFMDNGGGATVELPYEVPVSDSWGLFNLRLGYSTARYNITVFGENLNDEIYQLGLDGGIYPGGFRVVVNEGRRFGVRGQVFF